MICVILAALVAVVSAQIPSFGGCPDVPLKPELDIQKYLGDWYEIQKFPTIFQRGQKCNKATYTLKDNGHINVFNSGIKTKDGSFTSATGDAYVKDPSKSPSDLGIKFGDKQPYGNYWVIDTDYTSYTLIYSCTNLPFKVGHVEMAWILSRTPQLNDTTTEKARNLLASHGVDVKKFTITDQTGCPEQ